MHKSYELKIEEKINISSLDENLGNGVFLHTVVKRLKMAAPEVTATEYNGGGSSNNSSSSRSVAERVIFQFSSRSISGKLTGIPVGKQRKTNVSGRDRETQAAR